jgi:hypothetical protein
VLGFDIKRYGWLSSESKSLYVVVPLWFPTLLLTGASLLIWRKRRAQAQRRLADGRGFALEPAAEEPEAPMIMTR